MRLPAAGRQIERKTDLLFGLRAKDLITARQVRAFTSDSPATFSRASTAGGVTTRDGAGNVYLAGGFAEDRLRMGVTEDEAGEWVPYFPLEAARTNELHNSDSPATQTRNLTAGTYTLWMEGSGSVDASGATDGSYGTATEGQSNDLTFTVSAQQDVTFTVNNTVTRFQCEEGSFRSSFIATAGSAVSRAADDLSFPISFGPQEATFYEKLVMNTPDSEGTNVSLSVGSDDNGFAVSSWLTWFSNGTVNVRLDDGTDNHEASVRPTGEWSIGDVIEVRGVMKSNGDVVCGVSINGGSEETATSSDAAVEVPSGWSEDRIALSRQDRRAMYDFISGPIIAPGVRTMDEMRRYAEMSPIRLAA